MFTKSKLLAAAISAAAAVLCSTGAYAVDAKGSVYGDLRYGLDHSDSSGPNSDAADRGPDTDFRELNSFIGVKAAAGTADWSAFGAYESYVDGALLGADTSRQKYIGVNTPFGTVAWGTMLTDYAKAGLAVDPFYNTSLASGVGGPPGSAGFPLLGGINAYTLTSFGLSPFLTGDLPLNLQALGATIAGANQANQIAYTSPAMGGVTINAALFIDENDDSATGPTGGESHDYGLGASWSMMGIKAGVQWLQINDNVGAGSFFTTPTTLTVGSLDSDALRLTAGYSGSNFGVNVSAERIDHHTVSGGQFPDEEYMLVSGWFGVASGTRLAASYGRTNETGFEGNGVQFGVFHDIVESFTVHAGASMYDLTEDQISGPGPAVDDTVTFALGASYKFDLGFTNVGK